MIELHERLSEFSYGYGVTREVERFLEAAGLAAVPFMPSLIHEKEIGFDVGFNRRGAPLLLQFKLGQSLTRFRRSNPGDTIPYLDRPFWRFNVDTAEPEGQFETLLKAEQDGAEVYYVAPKFSDWPDYSEAFEDGEVLNRSALMRPSEIREALIAEGEPDGPHRIVYDKARVYVCSRPSRIFGVGLDEAIEQFAEKIRSSDRTLEDVLDDVLEGFEYRDEVRRFDHQVEVKKDLRDHRVPGRASPETIRTDRKRRLEKFMARSKTEEDAIAAAVGTEFWMLGIQMIMAVEDETW
ncbi:hypothetical protein [Sphingobium chungbukense]|uniref:Uncharacterized protein n=1 Tax=Sphingobium chungbukense TaxID=56193 RepID=A0A0M3AJZ1_9SPHN|nr:hypothetical protein [Sphingobium chungbukense]KKW90175.1 hypothetical protein YP76_22360 [Sphingobium chungbukense]